MEEKEFPELETVRCCANCDDVIREYDGIYHCKKRPEQEKPTAHYNFEEVYPYNICNLYKGE